MRGIKPIPEGAPRQASVEGQSDGSRIRCACIWYAVLFRTSSPGVVGLPKLTDTLFATFNASNAGVSLRSHDALLKASVCVMLGRRSKNLGSLNGCAHHGIWRQAIRLASFRVRNSRLETRNSVFEMYQKLGSDPNSDTFRDPRPEGRVAIYDSRVTTHELRISVPQIVIACWSPVTGHSITT